MRKIWILLIPTLALCFLVGFAIGAFPSQFRKLIGKDTHNLLLLTSDSKLIPAQFLLDYEKATGHSVKVKEIPGYHLFRTEAASADLLFAPLSWLNQFPETLKALPQEETLRELLSSDFRSLKLELTYFLPVLWKTEQKQDGIHLLIWGFSTPNTNKAEVLEFLQFLLTNSLRIQSWAPQVSGYNFTLQSSNDLQDFPMAQRAQKIREVSLPKLIIEQKVP